MKRIMLAALLGVAALSAGAANIGVSVNIGDLNYYGSIDAGNYPPPAAAGTRIQQSSSHRLGIVAVAIAISACPA